MRRVRAVNALQVEEAELFAGQVTVTEKGRKEVIKKDKNSTFYQRSRLVGRLM